VAVQADVSREEDVRTIFDGPLRALPPLRGVIHSAGRFDGGLLMDLDRERFLNVTDPKSRGAWLLHRMTEHCALDFFVLYSSVSALLGAPGQGNYAAANAFLDGLAHYRRARGLPAQSIDWGLWGSIGAAVGAKASERIERQGLAEFSPEQGLDALERVLLAGWTQPGVMRADWRRIAATINNPAETRFFEHLAGKTVPARNAGGGLRDAPPEKRCGLLLKRVRAEVAAVIGLPMAQPGLDKQPLRDMGLDSLMAVELCNRLRHELGIEQALPATVAFDHPTVAALSEYLAGMLGWTAAAAPGEETDVLGRIEQMTDEEVDRLLSLRTTGIL
jgi:acyl carrier protein